MIRRALVLLAFVVLLPGSLFAQDGSHWGVAVAVNPTWKAMDQFKVLFNGDTAVDIKSQDFSIGIARGKSLGGDWSVSYVRKNFKNGSFADNRETQCDTFVTGCFTTGTLRTLNGVKLSGIEAVKFIKIVNIKNRVQIGLNVGGGIGKLSGPVEIRDFDVTTSCNNTGNCTGTAVQHVSTVDAGAEVCGSNGGDCDPALYALPKYPLGKVEIAAGVILVPGLKIRASGGLDFPGVSTFRITGVYLIGAK
jgi:hypothetical protein